MHKNSASGGGGPQVNARGELNLPISHLIFGSSSADLRSRWRYWVIWRAARIVTLASAGLLPGCTSVAHRVDDSPPGYRGRLWRFESPTADIRDARFSPDGRFILVRSPYACRVLDVQSGRVASVFENGGELRRPLDYLHGAVILVPWTVAEIWWACQLRFRDFSGPHASPSESPQTTRPPPPKSQPKPGSRQIALASWAVDSQRIFYLDRTSRLRVYAAETGRLVTAIPVAIGPNEMVKEIGPREELEVWLGNETVLNSSLEVRHKDSAWRRACPAQSSASFAATSSIAAVSMSDGTIHIIDCDTGDDLSQLPVEEGCRSSLNADGTRLVVDRIESCIDRRGTSCSTSVKTLDTMTGALLAEIQPVALGIRGHLVDWSDATGQGLFYNFPSGSSSEMVLLDLDTGRETCRIPLSNESVYDLSPDGRTVVTIERGLRVCLYQVHD